MILNSEPQQHQTPPYAGIPVTHTCGYNVLQVLSLLFAGHAHIVGLQIPNYPANYPFCPYTVPTPTNESKPFTTTLTSGEQLFNRVHPILRPATCHALIGNLSPPQYTFPHRSELCGANHSAKYCPNKGSLSQQTYTQDPNITIYSQTQGK